MLLNVVDTCKMAVVRQKLTLEELQAHIKVNPRIQEESVIDFVTDWEISTDYEPHLPVTQTRNAVNAYDSVNDQATEILGKF